MVPPETYIPVVGEPVAWAIGLFALILVVFTGSWAASLVTVAHEGGHVMVAILVGRDPKFFEVNEGAGGGGATHYEKDAWIPAIFSGVAGYLTPSLLGLAGASAVRAGLSWSVLWAAVVLLFGAFFMAKPGFTTVVVALAGGGIAWAAVAGGTTVRAAVAAGVVWLMLFGSIRSLVGLGTGGGTSDPANLRRRTLIPGIVWIALFWAVAVACLFFGAKRLLIP